MERKVGERVKVNILGQEKILEVTESDKFKICDGCIFKTREKGLDCCCEMVNWKEEGLISREQFLRLSEKLGECSSNRRIDRKYVVFKEVK